MAWKPETKERIDGLSEWDVKFLRETPFMAFGSMMNSYGLMWKGKEKPLDEFLKDSQQIFKMAIKLSGGAYAQGEITAKKTAEQLEEEMNNAGLDEQEDFDPQESDINN